MKQISLFGHFLLIFFCVNSCIGTTSPSQKMDDNKSVLVLKDKKFDNSSATSIMGSREKAQKIEFENCTFSGSFSFTGLEIGYNAFQVSCSFKNCSFEGDLTGKTTQFLGSLNFNKCRFKKNVIFQNSAFLGPVAIKDCTFDGDGLFQNAIFFRESMFMGSHFYGIPFFQSARFFEKGSFINVVFHSNTDFTIVRFSEGVNMDFVRAEGNLDFTDSRFEGISSFKKAELVKGVNLCNIRAFSTIRFSETTFLDSLKTTGAKFFSEKLEIVQPKGTFAPAGD